MVITRIDNAAKLDLKSLLKGEFQKNLNKHLRNIIETSTNMESKQ